MARTVSGRRLQRRPPREARELEARLLVEVALGEHRTSTVTLAAVLKRWLDHAGPDLSPTTLHTYRSYIERLLVPRLGGVQLHDLTTIHLDSLYRALRESGGASGRPLSAATVRQVHAIVRRALVQAQRWGLTNDNPAVLASPPKVQRSRIHPPSAEQVAGIVGAARARDPLLGLAVWLAAVTGARRGELCGLRWYDVDLHSQSVVIRRSVVEVPGQLVVKDPKSHRVRRVALDGETCDLLRARQASQAEAAKGARVALDEDAYVLSEEPAGDTPLDPRRLSHRFRALTRNASIECRFHDLRHWHVTQALGTGLPVRDVAERVGHASARMTLDVYGHAIKGADHGAVEAVATLLSESL